jgi:2-polyprenyl-6-methoxyphenol hydroxylase-like FAD-dependent oxidoreductase
VVTKEVPAVLIIGAGPVGAVLALELARHGVASTVVERSHAAPLFPKMDFLNGRTMELLRRLDLADPVREVGVDTGFGANFVWTDGLNRPPIAVWPYPSPASLAAAEATDGSAPLEPYQRIPGSVLEDLLRARLRRHPLVDLREGWTCTGVEQSGDGVVAAVREEATGATHRLTARHLVGCDGAGSVVRRSLDVAMPVTAPPTQRLSVYFRSADPALRAHGRAFVTTSSTGVTLVSRDERDAWTASFQLPADWSADDDPVAELRRRLRVDVAVDEVLAVSSWQGALAVADRYRVGSVFLAGDAAHQYYPFGGHGANTGIADAVDLGWKLAAALQGWGGPELLDSYEAERRPVALFNREMCTNMLEVARRFAVLSAAGASRAHLAGFLAEETAQVENVGIHFGYRYDSPVIAREPGQAPPWEWRRIVPTTWPGGRPPSLRTGGEALFDRFGPGFTLVDLSGVDAGAVLAKEAVRRGIPVAHLVVDDPAVRAVWERELVLVRPDQHVAWRGDAAPADWGAVLDLVTGQ